MYRFTAKCFKVPGMQW